MQSDDRQRRRCAQRRNRKCAEHLACRMFLTIQLPICCHHLFHHPYTPTAPYPLRTCMTMKSNTMVAIITTGKTTMMITAMTTVVTMATTTIMATTTTILMRTMRKTARSVCHSTVWKDFGTWPVVNADCHNFVNQNIDPWLSLHRGSDFFDTTLMVEYGCLSATTRYGVLNYI